ncbi:MAG: phosphate propanoyltransferase [Bacilli bacterium]|nr:phosphate propanoyltransferase [Bacilli bacterium]
MKVLIETSARHIHLSPEHLEVLCGKDFALESKKPLSQPGQYVSTTRLDVVGPKATIKGVSVLGPVRPKTQVEVSMTDARSLGVIAPIRESGDVVKSAPIKIVGPVGSVEIEEGVIIAKRHIHMTTEDAAKAGLKSGDVIMIDVTTPERGIIFKDVVVRVSDRFATAVHIDTDESNAANACADGCGPLYGEIIK